MDETKSDYPHNALKDDPYKAVAEKVKLTAGLIAEKRRNTAGAVKYDQAKTPIYSLFLRYFPKAIKAVALVSEYGARKYAADGWRSVENGVSRYTDADARHMILEIVEGPFDHEDSGLAHAAQHAWNAMARLELMIEGGGNGLIRRGNDIKEGKPVLGTSKIVT